MDKISYRHFVLIFVLVVILAVVVSCGRREPAPIRPTPTGEGNAEGTTTVTVTGTVQDVMRSAQIIMFREPVKGFLYVALTQDTRLISREGHNITLQEIEAGMRIQVTGRPGSQGTLLAEEVRILP